MQKDLVKNIIFDLGGVFLNIDYNRTKTEFEKLGVSNFDQLFSQKQQTPLFDKFETGVIDEDEFFQEIQKEIPKSNTEQIRFAWNSMLGQLKTEEFELLQSIQNHYNICLLSNTNYVHLQWIKYNIPQYQNFEKLFQKTFYSHEIGLRKPNTEAFEFVLKKMNWNPSDTLFIDDTYQHTVGALSVGIQSLHLQLNLGESLLKHFDKHGKLF